MQESEISILYVEDDQVMREAVASRLSRRFEKMYICSSAEEALDIFKKYHVDLVLTDYMLPGLNGIELIASIRQKNWDIPIVLITGYADSDFLMEAINLGVTQFVTKPIDPAVLMNAIDFAIQRVVNENLKRKNSQQELELLKFREKYHYSQQEAAFKKELKALKNDYHERIIDVSGRRWMIDTLYQGLDIICGDAFSVRRLDDRHLFCFVLDAMGKGVGASITSMSATHYLNHQVDLLGKELTLEKIVGGFLPYIEKILLEEEILCAAFITVDFEKEALRYATFSMPNILLGYSDGSVKEIASNNIPIIKSKTDFEVGEISIRTIQRLMITSDGLTEAEQGDVVYEQLIKSDFSQCGILSSFKSTLEERGMEPKDDVTVFFLRRAVKDPAWEVACTVESTLAGVAELDEFFKDSVANLEISEELGTKLFVAYSEAVINAFEHGSLEIGMREKHNSINEDRYETLLNKKSLENRHKKITCSVAYIDERIPILRISVLDEGKGVINYGFDSDRSEAIFCGRGVEIIRNYVDQLYYSETGNEIIMLKTL
ncbi:MAG: response regulator [Deferribacteraceae bacterium]|jgi:DNA-binding response OmpR family regulator/anti-sigma regulatory factor (Ser/Thr protein kinase)|nr:response regulator [Deferribacteraceae bacterium]